MFARLNKWVLSIDLKTVSDGLSSTVLGSEFQTAGAEWRKPREAKSVLVEGRDSKRIEDAAHCDVSVGDSWGRLVCSGLDLECEHYCLVHDTRSTLNSRTVVTNADGIRGDGVFTAVCLCVCLSVVLHDTSKTDAARITKLDTEMFHNESWKPI